MYEAMSHTNAVPSPVAQARRLPFGEKATLLTGPLLPGIEPTNRSLDESHSKTTPLFAPIAISVPWVSTARTGPAYVGMVEEIRLPARSQTWAVWFSFPVTSCSLLMKASEVKRPGAVSRILTRDASNA